jgi:hypothetical protein
MKKVVFTRLYDGGCRIIGAGSCFKTRENKSGFLDFVELPESGNSTSLGMTELD